jgi:hypothetical protein
MSARLIRVNIHFTGFLYHPHDLKERQPFHVDKRSLIKRLERTDSDQSV